MKCISYIGNSCGSEETLGRKKMKGGLKKNKGKRKYKLNCETEIK
jgi:hypothetical protein